jgi:FixJ family two-component response regulator
MMPEVSGLDLHEWLRERNPRLARQWVFITGGAFTPRTQNYLASVDNPSLEKPIDANRLRTIVAEFVRINEEGGQSIVRVERRKKA